MSVVHSEFEFGNDHASRCSQAGRTKYRFFDKLLKGDTNCRQLAESRRGSYRIQEYVFIFFLIFVSLPISCRDRGRRPVFIICVTEIRVWQEILENFSIARMSEFSRTGDAAPNSEHTERIAQIRVSRNEEKDFHEACAVYCVISCPLISASSFDCCHVR